MNADTQQPMDPAAFAEQWRESHAAPSERIARYRRGRLVPIPARWRGKVTHRQTISGRQSKLTRKQRNRRQDPSNHRLRTEARAPKIDEWDDHN